MPHCLLSCAGMMPAVCTCNACAAVHEWLYAFPGPEWPLVAATTELSLLLCVHVTTCAVPLSGRRIVLVGMPQFEWACSDKM